MGSTSGGKEVDVVMCERGVPVWLIECKHADNRPAASPIRCAGYFQNARDQRVRELRREKYRKSVMIASGANWLAELVV